MTARQEPTDVPTLRDFRRQGRLVVSASTSELERACRRGEHAIDAREVAERLMDELPDLFGVGAEGVR